jgi:hypothetical protein
MGYHRSSLFKSAALLAVLATPLTAQGVPDTSQRVLDLHSIIERRGAEVGPLVWPGFRPDTVPTLYVIAHRGKVLVQWRHAWPAGFEPVPGVPGVGTAGSGPVSLPSGRFIAFMSVDSTMSPGLVVGTAIHEAFHSYERSVMQEGRTFGAWENAMLVGTYPVFDVENEAAFALEGRRLRQALGAPTAAEARRVAREFLALRESRQRVLDSEFTEFERLAELNEGLAQYALLRGLAELGRLEGGGWADAARHEAAVESSLLDSLLHLGQRSVRRRFYATGSAMALLLDRLSGADWKRQLMEENLDLQETLAHVTGFNSLGQAPTAADRLDLARVTSEAARAVARLKATRRGQADSILGSTFRLVIDPRALGPGGLQWCGFDPQNTLQTGDGRTLHLRFLRVCAGTLATGEFDRAVVQEDESGVLRLGLTDSLEAGSAAGQVDLVEARPVEVRGLVLESSGVRLEAVRARLTRRGPEVVVELLPENG